MLARIVGSLLFLTGLCNDAGSQDVAKPNEKHGEQGNKHKSPANHLKGETSPYLLQHLHNPVDWYPWGKEAIAKAKKEDKPIFLSIGYSACHWCHVMEHESFENEAIAKLMNQWFVCIKVDREERPDIDEIYMAATVAITGSGGWPMSVFLTPDLEPFWAGTYFPPDDKFGRPGFKKVLTQMHDFWTHRREDVIKQARQITDYVKHHEVLPTAGKVPEFEALFTKALGNAEARFDKVHGGFGQAPQWAPKFPHCTELLFLLRHVGNFGMDKAEGALEVVETTLEKMAQGGIYDQIGGGFARYSVDREWTVPHFEKMLYDNSQLASLYLEAWQATGKDLYKRIATETLDYVQREMTSPEGGFYSTTDADSDGVEGKFFVWSLDEIERIAGEDAKPVVRYYGVTKQGNFEGKNILTNRVGIGTVAAELGQPRAKIAAAIARVRKKLYDERAKRVHPGLDDKILASWNGLMLSAFARAAQVLGDERYLATAQKNAAFLLDKMVQGGRLMRTRRGDRTHLQGYLEDYAFVVAGLLDLYEADLDLRWLEAAIGLQATVEAHFADKKSGAYFSTADDHEKLLLRRSSAQESSLPSDVGVAAMDAARLGLITGDANLVDRARTVLERHSAELQKFPNAFGQLLLVAQFLSANPAEVYVVGPRDADATKGFLSKLRQEWPPQRVFVWIDPAKAGAVEKLLPPAAGKTLVDGMPAAYVCYQGVCKKPLVDPGRMQ